MSKMENSLTINECCDILDNYRVPINDEVRQTIPGNIPYYGANGIQGYINKYIFDEELILMAEDGGNFEQYDTRPIAYKINGKSWVNNHAHILRAKNGFVQDYIFYSLVHRNILKYIKGGTRSKLNKSELEKIEIKFPIHYKTQRKIAHILSTADAVIEKTQAAIAKYKAIKQGMLHDLFTRGIDLKTNKLRPKYEDAPELYKESKLGWIPKEWEVERLGKCGTFRKGANIPKYLLAHSGKGCILYGQLYTTFNNVIKSTESKIPDDFTKGLLPIKYGDILFAGSGETHDEIGKSAVLLSKDEIYAGGDIIILNLSDKHYKPFFGYFLNFEFVQRQKAKFGQGSSVIHIYANHLSNILVALPQKLEQEKIFTIIDKLNTKIQTEQNYLQKQQQIKAGLMADLLSGKKEVVVDEETAN